MKNGEGYHDPTASAAINKAFKSEKKKLMQISSMRKAGQKECLTYSTGECVKVVNGEKEICPLKGDIRLCLALTGTNTEIETAYRKMFTVEQHG